MKSVRDVRFMASHLIRRVKERVRYPQESVQFASRKPTFDRQSFEIPSHSITTDAAQYLHDYIVANGLKNGVEIGSKFGWSGLWLAKALEKNGGRLLQLDMKLRKPLVANFSKAEVKNSTLILGDSTSAEVAARVEEYVAEHGPFDFAFIDGDHSYEGCQSDWLLVRRFGAPTMHVAFDNQWQCTGVQKCFDDAQAEKKWIVSGFRKDANSRWEPECMAMLVARGQYQFSSSPARLAAQKAPWGAYLVTSSGKSELA